jgi:hypothetical protein
MFLFELDSPASDTVRLVAVTNQLKDSINKGQAKPDWTEEEFLSYLNKYGLNLSVDSLRDMIKKPPLNNVISNIQAGNVVFVGQETGVESNPDQQQSQQVVKQMAQSAMK